MLRAFNQYQICLLSLENGFMPHMKVIAEELARVLITKVDRFSCRKNFKISH